MQKVCVIMSVYKNDKIKYLKEALKSLYAQTLKVDIFIQQDGKLAKELEQYLDNELKSENIIYLGKRDENLGLSVALNELLKIVLSKYCYIIRMDADDICVDNRIEKQVDFLDQNPSIDAIGGWIEEFNMDTNERQVVKYGEYHNDLRLNLMKRNPLAHVTICFRNSFFDTISLYDTSKSNEDYDLWIRAISNGLTLHCLQEVLVYVRTSNAFFDRRKNMQRAVEVMMLKFRATKDFGFGVRGYLYAVAHLMLFLSPSAIKRYLYKKMRN